MDALAPVLPARASCYAAAVYFSRGFSRSAAKSAG
jgi:hypothetical protein